MKDRPALCALSYQPTILIIVQGRHRLNARRVRSYESPVSERSPLKSSTALARAGVKGSTNPFESQGAGAPVHRNARQRHEDGANRP